MKELIKEYIIHSPEEMIALGKELVQHSGYMKFWITWELGAGKTHFTKWVAIGLGLDEAQVHSPTYVYYHEYWERLRKIEKNWEKPATLLHVDMYRMTDPMLLVKSWLSDIMEDTEYRCIEWPKYEWIDDDGVLHLEIEIVDGTTRKVRLFKTLS